MTQIRHKFIFADAWSNHLSEFFLSELGNSDFPVEMERTLRLLDLNKCWWVLPVLPLLFLIGRVCKQFKATNTQMT